MVKITRVYTRTGDKGKTGLPGRKHVKKIAPRIVAIGCIDELNSFLGLARAMLQRNDSAKITAQLIRIQTTLYDLGANLAASKKTIDPQSKLRETDVKLLETEIDAMNKSLPTLPSFILPGENLISAQFHVARTVCRRTEIALLQLAQSAKIDDVEKAYINRLSDWLFVAARYVAQCEGAAEILWQRGKRDFTN